ncbi:hypothetical protein E8L99_20085 [Phreatobacter aquaticus]|uniref:Uncharacterized protein n=1 Tax=Phreatobacter aquaticus TaxID=2570229 RepID=A0A4D7QJW5_9HYPH|nr:hypothetical protein [Phreatobacter aquaticus]QCK87888.1 hypothetical protein E8L99_20085 [Phreatobacter aquaticus]
MRATGWFKSSGLSAVLGALAIAGLLTLGLATDARANNVTDKLKDCMGVVGAVVHGVDAVAEGAVKVADALADPTYAQCVSQAAAGDPFTIAAMAAMTGIYVATTAGGNEPFTDPASCNAAIGSFVATQIADFLSGLIEDPDSLIGSALRSMLPEAAIDVINAVAHEAAGDIGKALGDKFMAALGPIGEYLKCGCAAAGTAAIVKNVAEDIVNAATAAGKSAEACADLGGMILEDPRAVVGALFDDPGAVVAAVVDAVCGINKTTKEICGTIGEIYQTAKEVCDAVHVCPGLEEIWGGVKDVGHSIGCFFSNCSDDPPPPTGPPAACSPGTTYQTLSDTRTCSCTLPNGWKTVWTPVYSSLNGGYIDTQVYTCAACSSAETNVDGWCRACPHGFNRDAATGQCSRPIICSPGSLINADNTGCWTCPAGFQFNTGGTGCTPSCAARPWLQYNASANDRPAGYNDAMFAPYAGGACQCPSGQYDTGSSCAAIPVCASGSFDQKAGRCIPSCGNSAVPSGRFIDGVETCDQCPNGQRNIDGTCRTPCASDQIRSGDSCMTCPGGTQISGGRGGNGEYLSCASVCGPGSTFQAAPFQAVTQANGSIGAGLQGTMAPGAGGPLAQAAGSIGGNHVVAGAEIAIQSTLPGGGMAGSAGTGGGAAPAPTCRPCADNERSVAVTMVTASGGSITQNQCAACPPGQISNRKGDQCIGRVAGLFPAIRRAVPRDVAPPARETPPRAAPARPATPTERAAPQPQRPATAQPAAAREPLRCPPGRVPNRAGTACVLDVGDFDRGPGGSSVGGRSGR